MILKSVFLAFYISVLTTLIHCNVDMLLTTNFRTPKNIAFASIGGGRSHHMWVLEILTELNQRCHNVSFYSRDDQLLFAKNYPVIKANQIGTEPQFLASPDVVKTLMSNPRDHSVIPKTVLTVIMERYVTELPIIQAYFERDEIDLVICDAFFVACADAAMLAKKPFVVTFTFGLSWDFGASYINNKVYDSAYPTIENESIWRRAHAAFIKYPLIRRRMRKSMKEAHALQRKLGLTPTLDMSDIRYRNALKLVNNVYGIELARFASPMVQMVGPVMPKSYPPLDEETRAFLDSRSRVAYIGFGQFAFSSPLLSEFVLRSLLTLKEEGHIDGIVWGRVKPDQLPSTVKVGNSTWTRNDILNSPEIRLMDWAPQFGILQHPSTSFFISHGGVGSLHEALYNNVRIFVFPFFGDQPTNARAIARTGFGRFVDKDFIKLDESGFKAIYDNMYEVAVDPKGEMQANVDRISATIQMYAANSIERSSDLVEEALFSSDENGVMFHRRAVGYDIHWFKRYNVDLYLLATTIALSAALSLFYLYNIFIKKNIQKLKQA